MTKITITIYKNSNRPKEGKRVTFDNKISLPKFLEICSSKLGFRGSRMFKVGGKEIDSVSAIENDDNLYISEGENYIEPESSSLSGSSRSRYYTSEIEKYKLAILGPAGVGKSAITLQYTNHKFIPDYLPTIEDEYTQKVEIDGRLVEISILDTAGEEEYIACRTNWINGRDGFLLTFSIDREPEIKSELDSLYKMIKMIHIDKDVPIVLVANKIDLIEKRKITIEQISKWAQEYKVNYFEVSAKLNSRIVDAFTCLIRQIRKNKGNTTKVTKLVKKKGFFEWCNLI